MMRHKILYLLLLLEISSAKAQELFPLSEPASNAPKGVVGVKALTNSYQEFDALRNMVGLRLIYGLLPRLTLMATISASNHHDVDLPANLVSHTHLGNQTIYHVSPFQRGIPYPYIFNGVYLYAKFRFMSIDRFKSHLRGAVYGEWSNVNVAHDEAEANLMDDTKGYGTGLILTYLKNHFAVSLNSGVVLPGSYAGNSTSYGLTLPTTIAYGRALNYNLSFGYLLFPKHYSSYQQINVNVYTEFVGKSYESARVCQNGMEIPLETPLLKAGNYLDVHPGIQFIFNSNTRVDLSVGLPLLRQSYTHFYPFTYLSIQRYLYNEKK